MILIDADKLIKDLSDLRKSPWANMPYVSADRKFGISEALDMIESIVRCEQPTVDAIPIEWIESQVDKGKWAELVQRWAERKEQKRKEYGKNTNGDNKS